MDTFKVIRGTQVVTPDLHPRDLQSNARMSQTPVGEPETMAQNTRHDYGPEHRQRTHTHSPRIEIKNS